MSHHLVLLGLEHVLAITEHSHIRKENKNLLFVYLFNGDLYFHDNCKETKLG